MIVATEVREKDRVNERERSQRKRSESKWYKIKVRTAQKYDNGRAESAKKNDRSGKSREQKMGHSNAEGGGAGRGLEMQGRAGQEVAGRTQGRLERVT